MAGQIDQHIVHQLVRTHFLDQRGDGTAQRIGMGKAGVEFDETAGQRGLHQPAADLGALARDVAEVQQQALAEHVVAHVAAQDAEINQKALAVLDDLRLGRFDGGLGRDTGADVGDAHAQGEGLGRLDFSGHGVVGVDVGGQEVIQHQQRLRTHHDVVGGDVDGGGLTSQGVGDLGADVVHAAVGGVATRTLRGNDQPVDVGIGLASQTAAVQRVDPRHAVYALKEGGADGVGIAGGDHRLLVLVLVEQLDLDVGELAVQAVADDHVGVEGLTLQGELLLDDDLDFGAVGVLRARSHRPQHGHQRHEGQPQPHRRAPQLRAPPRSTSSHTPSSSSRGAQLGARSTLVF